MSKLSAQIDNRKIVTASSGNHAIATAHAAKILSREVMVVVPEGVVQAKLAKIQAYEVETIHHGTDSGQSEQHARNLATSKGYDYLSPYNDPHIIAGQGTIGLEILEQCKQVDNVFVAMGGGGLIGGIGSVIKAFSPQTKIYGVSAINSKALAESMAAGRVVETEHQKTLADGVAGGLDLDSITLPLAMSVVDQVIQCDESEIRSALRTLAFDENLIVEGSAALALAGYNKVSKTVAGQISVLVLCGGNLDRDTIENEVLGLSDLA
ncbi:threonine dehydratase [Alternaria alternata]|jgi:threonine dehydratase|nr:threonine dehydratase [Alternaria alternata]RYO53702.1 hypothetical protein AA0116_g10724 [Alternaria tenuissima]